MSYEEKYLGNNRLGVFADAYGENSFILKTRDMVFARVNKCGKWHVWFYKKHIQKDFDKLRDALSVVNDEFIKWWGNEVHKRTTS